MIGAIDTPGSGVTASQKSQESQPIRKPITLGEFTDKVAAACYELGYCVESSDLLGVVNGDDLVIMAGGIPDAVDAWAVDAAIRWAIQNGKAQTAGMLICGACGPVYFNTSAKACPMCGDGFLSGTDLVTCKTCQHYTPANDNPQGIGDCAKSCKPSPPCYPSVKRICAKWADL